MRDLQGEIEIFVRHYRENVLSVKTRKVELLGRKCQPQLMYTFLGFELKLGRKRLTCPDMTTARYLRIFGQLGMDRIEIPYDPTHTARVLPLFERSMEKIDRWLSEGRQAGELLQHKKTQSIYRKIRSKLRNVRDVNPQ